MDIGQWCISGFLSAGVGRHNKLIPVVCGFNILHFGSVSVRLFEKRGFGSVSVFSSQRQGLSVQWMASYVLTHFIDDYISACVTLLMLLRSLNYTFSRDTRRSHDYEINCNCVRQCFMNVLPVKPTKKTHFFVRVSFSNAMILIQEFERSRLLNFQMMHVIIE